MSFVLSGEIDETHQWAPELKDITYDNVSYEGLRKTDDYGKASLKGVSPVAIGDGPKWIKGNPTESMFSVYSSSPVGIFGGHCLSNECGGYSPTGLQCHRLLYRETLSGLSLL